MSEKFPQPVELFGEDPDDYALRSVAAADVLEQTNSEPGVQTPPEVTSEINETYEPLIDDIIGTRDEPKLSTGERINLADGRTYVIEHIDHNGRGIIMIEDGGANSVSLSFRKFFEILLTD